MEIGGNLVQPASRYLEVSRGIIVLGIIASHILDIKMGDIARDETS